MILIYDITDKDLSINSRFLCIELIEKVGDIQEAKAIYNAYCKDRTEPLYVGLLKSNIGHGEGASGLSAITKVVISYENKCIPANLNLKKLKSTIAEMSPPLLPVNDNLPYSPGIDRFLENLRIILLSKKYFFTVIIIIIKFQFIFKNFLKVFKF